MELNPFIAAQHALRWVLATQGVRSRRGIFQGETVYYYDVAGTGPGPVALLVHGLGGSAAGFFRIFSDLSRRFRRILAPDLPGHGLSPLPPGGPLTLARQLEVLASFSEQVVGEGALLVGNSLGAAMSLMLAHERPHLVRALALLAPAGARLPAEKIAEVARMMKVRTTEEARELTRRIFHRPPVTAQLFAPMLRYMYGTPAVVAAFDEVRPEGGLAPELLAQLSMPVLLLWGESDRLLPSLTLDYFRAHLPPSAQIHMLPRAGHVPQVERPAEVVRHLLRFADAACL